MIDLDPRYLGMVREILARLVPECEVRVIGSRVLGKARPFSDIDLVLNGPAEIEWRRIEALKDAFSESDLPMMVDVLDWRTLSDPFRSAIQGKSEILQRPLVA